MGLLSKAVIAVPVLSALTAVLYPKLEFAGVFRTATEQNNLNCKAIPGLEACEDAWIHQDSGLAYLPCSSIAARANWLPAMLHLNATGLASAPSDFIALYSFDSNSYTTLKLINTPAGFPGVFVHAIEVHESPAEATAVGEEPKSGLLTIFINSHRPPLDSAKGSEGALSVVEIFETRLGESELKWVKTVRNELVRTPNSMAAVGPRAFYISNDHRRKNHWSRLLEALYCEPSDIVYCDASGEEADCKVAADGLIYPNGLLATPSGLIYSASTLAGNLHVFEQQPDHTLVEIDEIVLPRPIDNIHVSSLTGAITAATFPKVLTFIDASTPVGREKGIVSPVEVWKVSNQTNGDEYMGAKYKVERIFADDGSRVSGSTTGTLYGEGKLLLAGVISQNVMVCDLA